MPADLGRFTCDRRRQFDPGRAEAAIAALAEWQHGVVSWAQLVAIGLGPSAIQHRIRMKRLHPVHRGVYAVGRRRLTRQGEVWAALLASGPGAVVSHRDAAAAWDLLLAGTGAVHVTVPARAGRGRPRIAIHRVRALDERDAAEVEGLPVTSVARTLLDVAETEPRRRLERAIDAAERHGLFDLRAIDDLCARSPGRRGVRPLRHAVAAWHAPALTRSELERRFASLCRQAGLPLPSQNVWLHGFEVDALWERQRVVVELDGYDYHRTRAAFERDRARDAALERAGYRVIRFSWRHVVHEPELVVATLRALLA